MVILAIKCGVIYIGCHLISGPCKLLRAFETFITHYFQHIIGRI